jgi:hypothetical protein
MPERTRVLTMVAALIPAGVVFAIPLSVGPAEHRVLAISVFMVVAWLLEPIHPAFIGLLGCVLFWTAAGIEFDAAFHGFLTPTPWFIYGAIILGVMADDTGVTRRIGDFLPRSLAESCAGAALALIIVGYCLGLIVPSPPATAFIVVLIAIGLVRRLEARPEPRGHQMLILGAGYAAALFGRSVSVGFEATWAQLPWDIAVAACCFAIACRRTWLAAPTADAWRLPAVPSVVMGADGLRVGVILAMTTLAWLTAPVHGVSPAIVGLAMGLVATVPGIGAAATERAAKPDPLAIIVVGSALSMPSVLAETGTLDVVRTTCVWFAHAAASWMPGKLAFYLAALGYHLFVPAAATQEITLAASLAAASGVAGAGAPVADTVLGTPGTGAVIWSAAGGVMFALYQSPALLLAATLAGFSSRQVWRIGVAVALSGAVAVLFLRA